MSSESTATTSFGLGEQRLRDGLEEELLRYMRSEGNAPTIHAIAAGIARILVEDHLLMAEQLEAAGVRISHARSHGRLSPES